MKKIKVLALVLFLTAVSACGTSKGNTTKKEEKGTVCTQEVTGVKSTLTYYADGDKVTKQKTKNVIDFKELGITKEKFEKTVEAGVETYKGIKGLTHKMDITNKNATEDLEIDYKVVDIEDVKNLDGMKMDDVGDAGISLSKSVDMLKESGFTCIEE